MRPYTVYISGPMLNKPAFNFPQFCEVEEWVGGVEGHMHLGRIGGVRAVNPARNFSGDTSLGREMYLELALRQVDECDGIIMLPGWEDSAGARLELARALHNSADVYEWHPREGIGPVFFQVANDAARERLEETAIPMQPIVGGHALMPDTLSAWMAVDTSQQRVLIDEHLNLTPTVQECRDGCGDDGKLTQFASGATRDTSDGKLDYEGFFHPLVMERFARYMDSHRRQSDGKLRSADNWQKGFTRASYAKSMFRHFMDAWANHRGVHTVATHEEALCGVIFNAQGYLFELLQGRDLKE